MSNYQLIKNTEWKEVEINGEDKEIPVDWEVKDIEKSFKVVGGGTPPTIEPSFWNGNIPWLGPKEMAKEKTSFIGFGEKNISEAGAKKLGNKNVLKNSVIISTRAPVGYVKFAKNDLYTNQGCHSLLPSEKVNNRYIFYWLIENKNILEQNSSGTTFKELSSGNLKAIEFQSPPLTQQSAIASILSEQESVIENIEQLIQKYESRFQYLSDELLSGRLRVKEVNGEMVLYKNPDDNWKEVEINGEDKEIPFDWEVFTLKDFGFIKTSSVDKKIKEGEQIVNLFNYMDVYRSTTKLVDSNIQFTKTSIKPHFLEENYIKKGDVFFTPSSETEDDIGYSSTAIEDIPNAVYSYHLIRFRPTKKLLDERFSGKIFNTKLCRDYFTEKCNGLTRMTLKKADFEELQLYFPTELLEQKNIYEVIHNQEKIIEYQKSILDKEKQRFNWLLDNLLSGKYIIK